MRTFFAYITVFASIIGSADSFAGNGALIEAKYRKYLVKEVRHIWGPSEDVSTFAAQIRQESNWNDSAVSPHAAGLTQFTRPTVEWIASLYPDLLEEGESPADVRFDWKWSIRAMVRYDRFLHSRVTSADVEAGLVWPLALRAYNGGLGWIYKEIASCGNFDMECCRTFRSWPSCVENIGYPVKVLVKWKPDYAGWDR